MQLFRPNLRFFVSEAIGALLALLFSVAWPLLKFENKSTAYLVAAGLVVLWLLFVGRYIWRLYRTRQEWWLQLDEESISGLLGDRPFRVEWKEVVAVSQRKEIIQQESITIFYLATEQRMYVIPLNQHFDTGRIWQLIQASAGPEATASHAYQNLPGYQSWLEKQTKPLTEQKLPFQVQDHPFIRIMGWLGLILFWGLAIMTWQSGERGMALLFVAFTPLSVYLILIYGRTQIDTSHITRITPLATYQIRWDEINRVEFYGSQTIVLQNNNKRLVIPGALSMAATNREEALAYIQAQILGRSIPTGTARFWPTSKNTKI